MTWYLDTSAFVKLARAEDESDAVRRWTAERVILSSDLLRTEARRAATNDTVATSLVEELLETMTLVRLTPELFDQAGRLRSATPLRSLDAIHIVAAMQLSRDLEGIVTYDRRMAMSAKSLGIRVAAPPDVG